LTDFHSLFVLDMMARDAGMRAVYIATHRCVAGSVSNTACSDRMIWFVRRHWSTAGYDWASSAAGIVTSFPDAVSVAAQHSSIAEARNIELTPCDLVSWVIAPPRRDI
jgi:hypothetical protein